jgi:hypothetical protein
LMGVSLFRLCSRVRRTYDSLTARNFAAAVQISLIGYATGGAFVNKALVWPITFQLLALMTAVATVFVYAQGEAGQRDTTEGHTGHRPKARPGVGRPKARPGVGRPTPARRGS